MKAKGGLIMTAAIALALQFSPAASAQDPNGGHNQARVRWANLSEAERNRLRTAHERALTDPQVRAAHDRLQQARHDFRQVMQPAMVKADPSVQPILEKMRVHRRDR